MFATQDQDNRGAGARGLTRSHHGAVARRLRRGVAGAVCAAAVMLPLIGAAGAQAATTTTAIPLTLLNGWTGYGSGTAQAAVTVNNGIVYLSGAISTSSGNTNDVAFVLPAGYRPSKYVSIPVDMCDSTGGELNIAPTGVTQVISGGSQSNATCFTSLDGASFALGSSTYTALALQPGWTEFGSFYRKAAARVAGGIVHLEGEIKTAGTNPAAFTLPAGFRPGANVYVLISLCTGSIGRLDIAPSGAVSVEAEGTGNWWMAQCGTSLDGASFALSPTSFTPLALQNGWMNAPYGTRNAAARNISGIVHLEGAIWTNGTNADPFILPAGLRPASVVYIPVDLCSGNNGRLDIAPDGVVTVQAQDNFGEAQCFTSLDGASFAG